MLLLSALTLVVVAQGQAPDFHWSGPLAAGS
jgi:hypothetical protein